MDDHTAAPHGDTQGESLTFSQTLDLKGFLGLSLKNGLLNIVTLTLYRFWGRTEVRRRVWSQIRMNDEPFEYTGRGLELFIGFAIALVTVGVPFLLVVFGAQFLGPLVASLIILPMYVGMFVLLGAAVFFAFRYMASRTVWRGIRFHLAGSPWEYGWAYLGYNMLTGLTFGWFAPAMAMRMGRKLWGGLAFGDQKFRWVPLASDGLYGPFAIGWAGTAVGYVLFLVSMVPMVMLTGMAPSGDGSTPPAPSLAFMAAFYAAALVFGVYVLAVFTPYQAAVLRAIVGSLKIGDARFELNVKAMELLGLTISNLLMLVLSLGFLSPYVQARTARFMVRRLSSKGDAPLDQARQARKGPKSGEGLADAFGFSPI